MNCPYCKRYFAKKPDIIDHINKFHQTMLDKDQMNADQALYFSTHGSLHGKCMCGCGRDTDWNYKTGKPFKVSTNPDCKKRLTKIAEDNLKRATGMTKQTMMNDINHQKEMMSHRPSFNYYTFRDGGVVDYMSSLELNFLKFCDLVMEFTSNMFIDPPMIFNYYDPKTKTNRQYLPDYYLPDYNLMIEIKDGGKATNTNPAFIEETKYKVALKDEVMKNQTDYNYIRISGATYGPFLDTLYKIVHDKTPDDKTRKNLVVITESASTELEDQVDYMAANYDDITNAYLDINIDPSTNLVKSIGLTERHDMERWFESDLTSCTLVDVDRFNPKIMLGKHYYYRYAGNIENIIPVFKLLHDLSVNSIVSTVWNILDILADFNILFDNGAGCSNNDSKITDFIFLYTNTRTTR